MKPHRGVLFGLLAGMLWGLDGVLLGRADSNGVLRAALIAACIHDGLAALWLFAVNAKNKKIKMYRNCLFSRQFLTVFLCALFGGAEGMTCNIIAINMAGASSACAVTSAYPVAGAVLGALFLHEKLTASSAAGIVLVAAGAAVIGFSENAAATALPTGLSFAAAAMLCWALEGVISKSAMVTTDSDILIGSRELLSCLIYLAALLILPPSEGFAKDGLPFIIAASAAGAFSYFCWYRSMDISGVTVGMSLNATYALWAVLLDIPVNGVSFSPQIFAGAVIILSGTLLTIYSDRKKGKQDEQQK